MGLDLPISENKQPALICHQMQVLAFVLVSDSNFVYMKHLGDTKYQRAPHPDI